jgi:predicted dinucleotide-binding enzyme
MRYAVLGTGSVGKAISEKLKALGHEVVMGSRSADNPQALEWTSAHEIPLQTFHDAAAWAQRLVNATGGVVSLEALTLAGAANLRGKILLDPSNPLDPTSGFPPTLSVANTDSLGEQIQRAFPETYVVKALNTMTAALMVNPGSVPGDHLVFLCGNDSAAKVEVVTLLGELGWPLPRVLDLGDITSARALEAYVTLWVRLYGTVGTGLFNIGVLRG